ncbi:molybdopterin-dependent oxidoreductase [Trinickia caryophylli]|uniref:DMSO/TMAO reductase YedYZ, molybdopterin-dependent catalytic subunit n=1 Tax=Trinickia caryophylli TaxID=28094 RepID=A0A1X7GJJ0_TRICW|nr:molybdopterin-dependent oxidoreductase [Trinickia caryophylli]PMS09916.1 sulfide dehydrogenase [Trinickia caryophylli]TRX14953.1 molybdopterin-dependent oxidoreductase [Trinickia caryophylli]WQE14809.1 molybdopterin-dependent oxidoreductase [Trinickia caryophylli]SMF70717.1 DMSO/TMAO reductase YedYZ, molybdopterin-dependent catalytic subunit [Trinickia caryophylli]GLU35010.1 oxidase [Trinickia caryophylli]
MSEHDFDPVSRHRRRLLGSLGALGAAAFAAPLLARAAQSEFVDLPFENGRRPITSDLPQKSGMILQRTRAPLLETPFEVFDRGVFTPNDRFYVRWHLPNIPTSIDPATYRLAVRGHVKRTLSLTLDDLMRKFPRYEIAAVNQCSGNSRGFFNPRVPGGQWANGAMGNALWMGVRLKDVLDHAGVRGNAVAVRFDGLDSGVIPQTPKFLKSLAVDHARDGEVMLAYAMNGEPLPLLNGYPLRLIVPGWYATYWVKMLTDIEVLDRPDDNFWTAKAYKVPDNHFANIHPGETDVPQIPINRMLPRSFFTNLRTGDKIGSGQPAVVRGIAFGGINALARVQLSVDGGRTWADTSLGHDYGKYSFRQWQTSVSFPQRGQQTLMVRAIDSTGQAQPPTPNWNGAGFMRNVIESIQVDVA